MLQRNLDLKDNKHQAAFATVSADDGDGSEKVTQGNC